MVKEAVQVLEDMVWERATVPGPVQGAVHPVHDFVRYLFLSTAHRWSSRKAKPLAKGAIPKNKQKAPPDPKFEFGWWLITASPSGHWQGRHSLLTLTWNVLLIPVSVAFSVAAEEELYTSSSVYCLLVLRAR